MQSFTQREGCVSYTSATNTWQDTVFLQLCGHKTGRMCLHRGTNGFSPLQKGFLFSHTTTFSTKGLEKSLCDFTGTILYSVRTLSCTTADNPNTESDEPRCWNLLQTPRDVHKGLRAYMFEV